ncbi:MAG: DUF969 family protein [Vicinamibacteria bacterium]|nr:DUF969 family protein [Vicinamibacteria bacterium]
MNPWPLLGVALVVAGFALRLNPLMVVVAAGLATGLFAGLPPDEVLRLLGEGVLRNRYLLLFVLTLPVIGLLERSGLREHAQATIAKLRSVTAGRLLMAYLALRQAMSMLGLTNIAGHAQTVRPLIAPMAEAAAERATGPLPPRTRERLLGLVAGTDNVGLFFGEDVFVAFGAVLLMQGFLESNGIVVEPIRIALWGLPTALAAFAIHGFRLWRLDARLQREAEAERAAAGESEPPR